MIKKELIDVVAEISGVRRKIVTLVLNSAIDSMCIALMQNKGIHLRDLGSFAVKELKAHKGRNLATGETVDVPAVKKVNFKASKRLKELLNGEG